MPPPPPPLLATRLPAHPHPPCPPPGPQVIPASCLTGSGLVLAPEFRGAVVPEELGTHAFELRDSAGRAFPVTITHKMQVRRACGWAGAGGVSRCSARVAGRRVPGEAGGSCRKLARRVGARSAGLHVAVEPWLAPAGGPSKACLLPLLPRTQSPIKP